MIKVGDKFTISGIYKGIKNPNRRWWTFWRPRIVADPNVLQQFRVVE